MIEQALLKAAKEAIIRASIGPAFDINNALKKAHEAEEGEAARVQLSAILKNVELSTSEKIAVCQDTGFPNFYIRLGDRFPLRSKIYGILTQAVREVTKELPLRPNTVHPLSEKNPGDNTGVGAPWFDLELFDGDYLEFYYVPKGGGTELPSKAFTLPPRRRHEGTTATSAGGRRRRGTHAVSPRDSGGRHRALRRHSG